MADLTVTSATIGPPDRDGARELRVRVRNDGAAQRHLSGELKDLGYDPATQRLTVEFGLPAADDPAPGVRMISTHPFIPHQIVVQPGEEGELHTVVPAAIRSFDQTWSLGSVAGPGTDVGAIADVEVRVASSETPFQPPLDLGLHERMRHMQDQARIEVQTVRPEPADPSAGDDDTSTESTD